MEKQIEDYLDGLSKEELKKALTHLLEQSQESRESFLKEAGPALEKNLGSLRNEKIRRQWDYVRERLETYDESDYGYFDYSADDNVDIDGCTLSSLHEDVEDDIKRLERLIQENNQMMSPSLKEEIRTACLDFIDGGVSYEFSDYGVFDDALLDVLKALCSTGEEKYKLAKELAERELGGEDFIAQVYAESLGPEQSLEYRLENCNYDVNELLSIIDGFIQLGQVDRAVSIARDKYAYSSNIRSNDSGQNRLWDFIEKSFKGDDAALASYIRTHEVNDSVKEHLFKHFKDKDYELSKGLLWDLVVCNKPYNNFLSWYREAKEYLKDEDIKPFGDSLKSRWKDSSKESWLRLCLEDGEYKTVLDAVLEDAPNAKPWEKTYYHRLEYEKHPPVDEDFHFSGAIAKHYPDKIRPYIKRRVEALAEAGERVNYENAVRGLAVLKTIEKTETFRKETIELIERYRTRRLLKQLISEKGLL